MQSVFQTYLQLGFSHISDLEGYDHILFIIALCAIYRLREWKSVALLVTAFTIGHSVTLALAVLGILPVNAAWIEFLIPVTIALTAIYNAVAHRKAKSNRIWDQTMKINYGFAALFGLIHGMGFSNFLRSSLMPGQEDQLLTQLFAFNIGVELGQLAIVAAVLALSAIALQLMRVQQREWNLFISGSAFGLALVMALERVGAIL
ncbi:MAG: HupE/UreJ family protein [Phaeodactylibacter sp.]|uniref:HupE/UreJ family protein n=1 Tax=Phaeodactylibacter sp. TaxID=1940289 RepID=UPI0032EAAFC2